MQKISRRQAEEKRKNRQALKIQYSRLKCILNQRIYANQLKIMRVSVLLLLLLISCVFAADLKLQYGTYIAKSSAGTGSIDLRCYGGSGSYEFMYNNLPQGWRSSGSTIVIPGIGAIFGRTFLINVEIKDKVTNVVLNGNIILIVNGVRVDVNSAGPGSVVLINPRAASAIGNNYSSGSSLSRTTSTNNLISSSSSSSSQISTLYSSYPGLPSNTNQISIPNNLYQTPAGAPSIPNPGPIIIANAQATYNASRDANKITIDEVKRTAIFNRQINANKAVANLITIIQRLTANVNAARSDIVTLEGVLRNANNANNACNEEIYGFANIRAQIDNAVADKQNALLVANTNIEDLENVLKNLRIELNTITSKRSTIEVQKIPNAAKLKSLEREISDCSAKKQKDLATISTINQKISELNSDIKNTKEGASSAPLLILQIDQQTPIVDRKIADLKRELADAQEEKSQLARDRIMYKNQIDQAELQVSRIQRQIAREKAKIPTLQSNVQSIQRSCNRVRTELNDFRASVFGIESSYTILENQITAQQALISSTENQIKLLKESIKDLPNQIKLLRTQANRVEAALRRQYYICEATADDVRAAQQNLEAMRIKLERESQFLSEANLNLQKARAEKELADVAVEEVIQTYTSALPFSITPNGLGLTNAGTPIGNNPSGSPLGPLPTSSNSGYQYQSVTIGDLNTYLSSAYRAGVDPARPETVSTLYPLSTTTLSTLVNQSNAGLVNSTPGLSRGLYDFQCNSSGTQITGSGKIYSVQPGLIQLSTNNGLANLRLSGCSNLQSVNQNQVLSKYDDVYFRGYSAGGNNINLQSMTCI